MSLALKEIRSAFDLFKLTPEEKNDFPENNQKREEIPLESKIAEDPKSQGNKQVIKERRTTRDETDTWAYIAAEGDQDAMDGVYQADENSGEYVCGHFADLFRVVHRIVSLSQSSPTVILISRSENNAIEDFISIS